jgi:alkanesulfonate monooxygenase SsuD/methylene tetrahydromethanopterin reductase-like flavin-dependent oxidoreductase (luciferase family)
MLGSSLFGASLAAKLGLPYAFAAHFAPDHLDAALALYRRDFQPSQACPRPHVMVAMNVFAAETEGGRRTDRVESGSRALLRLAHRHSRQAAASGEGYPIPHCRQHAQAMLAHLGQAAAVGTPAKCVNRSRRLLPAPVQTRSCCADRPMIRRPAHPFARMTLAAMQATVPA